MFSAICRWFDKFLSLHLLYSYIIGYRWWHRHAPILEKRFMCISARSTYSLATKGVSLTSKWRRVDRPSPRSRRRSLRPVRHPKNRRKGRRRRRSDEKCVTRCHKPWGSEQDMSNGVTGWNYNDTMIIAFSRTLVSFACKDRQGSSEDPVVGPECLQLFVHLGGPWGLWLDLGHWEWPAARRSRGKRGDLHRDWDLAKPFAHEPRHQAFGSQGAVGWSVWKLNADKSHSTNNRCGTLFLIHRLLKCFYTCDSVSSCERHTFVETTLIPRCPDQDGQLLADLESSEMETEEPNPPMEPAASAAAIAGGASKEEDLDELRKLFKDVEKGRVWDDEDHGGTILLNFLVFSCADHGNQKFWALMWETWIEGRAFTIG